MTAPAAAPPAAPSEVLELIRPAGQRILHVGCGEGTLGADLLAAGAVEVVGVEPRAEIARAARGRLTAVLRASIDARPSLPYPDGYFDVLVIEELAALDDAAGALSHLRRWLADDGRLVAAVSNARHQDALLPLLADWRGAPARTMTIGGGLAALTAAGFALTGSVQLGGGEPHPALAALAEVVRELGGDAERFAVEALVTECIVTARPTSPRAAAPPRLPDPWAGSKPVRVLLAPDVDDPRDRWIAALGEVTRGLADNAAVTVGVALPARLLSALPAAVQQIGERATVDLLLIEAPQDEAGWERLMAGACSWLVTAPRPGLPDLPALAERAGVDVRRVG